jgi:hypothetical protein
MSKGDAPPPLPLICYAIFEKQSCLPVSAGLGRVYYTFLD